MQTLTPPSLQPVSALIPSQQFPDGQGEEPVLQSICAKGNGTSDAKHTNEGEEYFFLRLFIFYALR